MLVINCCFLVAMTCPKLQPPRDGFFVQDTCDNVFHAACGVKCEPGYKLVGSSVRLCEADGVWSGEPAKCEGNFKEGRYSILMLFRPRST